ncbi:MAG: hypothetical protein IPM82_11825 [Saprospiraceae bacterium]|nr:hypothetical protein [Saprospiraceae bacterium]
MVCPEEVKARYVGTKLKKILLGDVYPHFGKPEDRPIDSKHRKILTRKDINRALSIEQSTLGRRLRELEEPQLTIGMTYEAFIKLRELPPRQVALILKYMATQGYPMK